MQRGSYPIHRRAAAAYPSVEGTKKDDLRIDAILVATYKGTCIDHKIQLKKCFFKNIVSDWLAGY